MRPVQQAMLWLGGMQLVCVLGLLSGALADWRRQPAAPRFVRRPRLAVPLLAVWGLCAAGQVVLALQ
jgi:hypothetical protein